MPQPVANVSIHSERDPGHDRRSSGTYTTTDLDHHLASFSTSEAEALDDNLRFLRGEISGTDSEEDDDDDDEGDEDKDPETDDVSDGSALVRTSGPRLEDLVIGHAWETSIQARELSELEERALQIFQQQERQIAWPDLSDDEDDGDGSQPHVRSAADWLSPAVLRGDESLRDRIRIRRLRDHSATQLAENRGSSQHVEYADPPLRQPSRFRETGMSASSQSPDTSLRTTAVLQAIRQNIQMAPRSRRQLQRFILDRERMGTDGGHATDLTASPPIEWDATRRRAGAQSQAPDSAGQPLVRHIPQQARRSQAAEIIHLNPHSSSTDPMRPMLDGIRERFSNRRRRLWQTSAGSPASNTIVETVKYLHILRCCETAREGLEAAEERGFDSDILPQRARDLVLHTSVIPRPVASSWLHVGSVFVGHQQAMPHSLLPIADTTQARNGAETRSRIRHPTFGSSMVRPTSPAAQQQISASATTQQDTSGERASSSAPNLASSRHEKEEDRWPVKVTIHAINFQDMTLSGIMEAFNVPDKSSPSKTSSIRTYLEGEIIDFRKFTLETKSFKSDSNIDGTYWRKLPPFKYMKDDRAVAKNLLSREWMSKELMPKWILMRWKEKHFVNPLDAYSSLTISGFYYASLNRHDGHVAGLYYDPSSTPYQHLALDPALPTFPAYDFV